MDQILWRAMVLGVVFSVPLWTAPLALVIPPFRRLVWYALYLFSQLVTYALFMPSIYLFI